jgi:hypothetical protein
VTVKKISTARNQNRKRTYSTYLALWKRRPEACQYRTDGRVNSPQRGIWSSSFFLFFRISTGVLTLRWRRMRSVSWSMYDISWSHQISCRRWISCQWNSHLPGILIIADPLPSRRYFPTKPSTYCTLIIHVQIVFMASQVRHERWRGSFLSCFTVQEFISIDESNLPKELVLWRKINPRNSSFKLWEKA